MILKFMKREWGQGEMESNYRDFPAPESRPEIVRASEECGCVWRVDDSLD